MKIHPIFLLLSGCICWALLGSCARSEGEKMVPVVFQSAVADGSNERRTTEIIFRFDVPIAKFSAQDITFMAGANGIEKGKLAQVEGQPGVYVLALEGVSSTRELTVEVGVKGHQITPTRHTTTVYYHENITGPVS